MLFIYSMDRLIKNLSDLLKIILKRRTWGISLILLVYSLVFPALVSAFSISSTIHFFIFPAMLIGYFYGLVWGVVGGALLLPLHAILFFLLQSSALSFDSEGHLFDAHFWATYICIIVTGGLVGYLQDFRKNLEHEVKTRRQVSNALRQSEQRYRYLLNHSANIIVLYDKDGVIEFATPSAERLTQYPIQEITGTHFSDLIHPDWKNKVKRFYARQIIKSTPKSYLEFPLMTKSGKTVWVGQTLELIYDNGKVTGGQGLINDITERHNAQQALATSEQRFRALTENSTDLTIIVDENKIVNYVSPSIQHIAGYAPSELQYQDIRQFIHPDDQTEFIQQFQQAVENSPETLVRTGTLQFAHKDGRWLYYDGTIINMLDVNSVNGIVFNIREITSRVQLEQALWESEYNFRTLFNQANDAVVILSIGGKIQEFNNRFASLMQLPRAELFSKPFTNFVAEENTPILDEHFKNLKNDQQVPISEIQMVNKHEDKIPFEINLGMVKDNSGKPQKVLAILRDISGQKRTEETLRHLATHDVLTQLPNRDLFYARLVDSCQHAAESDYRVVVVFLDCNNFKYINDVYGHHAGDQALITMTQRIKGCLRANDTLARMGGDEFTILLEGIQTIENAETILKKIINTIQVPMEIDQKTIQMQVGIGISIFPNDSTDPEIILQNADQAMYVAKSKPEEEYIFFHQL